MKIEALVENLGLALDLEIAAARRRSGARYCLYDGRLLGEGNGEFLYEFNSGVEVVFQDECPGELELHGRQYRCTIISSAEGHVAIAVQQQIEEVLSRATLSCAPWFLLQTLKARTLEITSLPLNLNTELVRKVFGFEEPRLPGAIGSVKTVIDGLPSYLNDYQRAAIAAGITREVFFEWGPPATTKTTLIGGIVRATIELGQTALVVAHSNVATDACVLSVARALNGTACLSEGGCLRVGVPRLPEVRAVADVNPREIIRRHQPDLVRELERLEQLEIQIRARLRQQTTPAEQTRLNRQLRSLREPMRSLTGEYAKFEAGLINNARVVVTTLSRMSLSPQIYGRTFDAILVDEASMATPPAVAVAVSLATKRAILAGDFRQLAPVALAKGPLAEQWLRRDLFEIAGVVKNVESGQPDSRLHLLDVQHRMHPGIRGLISDTFYGGRLRDGEHVLDDTIPLAALSPSPGRPIVVCDIGALRPQCHNEERGGRPRGSHFNIGSALASLDLARQSIASGARQVAIISPYNCEARVLSMLVRESQLHHSVRVATVHQFQGGESDVVILDLVDAPPLKQPGLPLRGCMGEAAARLLNVAVSRARGKLVLVCDLPFIRSTSPQNSVLRSLLVSIGDSATIDFSPVLREDQPPGVSPGITWFSRQAMLARLAADVERATRQVTVNTAMRSLLNIFNARIRVLLANRGVNLGIAALPAIASPELQDDADAFEDPVTAEQLALVDSTLWFAGVASPGGHANVFARINLPETAVVIAHMVGLTAIQPLLAPEADLLQQALDAQTMPPEPSTSGAVRTVPHITFGRRRLGI